MQHSRNKHTTNHDKNSLNFFTTPLEFTTDPFNNAKIIFLIHPPTFTARVFNCFIIDLQRLTFLNFVHKKSRLRSEICFFAEREGFEPPVPFSTSVFKTGAIDHSATSPISKLNAVVSFNGCKDMALF